MGAWSATNKMLFSSIARPSELMRIINRSPDLHAFPRVIAVKKVFKKGTPAIEAGAADGWFSFELAPFFDTPILAMAYTDAEYEAMKKNIRMLRLTGLVSAGKDDAQTLETVKGGSVEQLMLVDVLEHVDDDISAIKAANRVLKTGGRLILSVPTPYYPYWFGYDFDRIIGHKRHFTKEDLERKLSPNGFEITEYFYYTSAAASKLMKLWYRDLKVWPKEFSSMAGGKGKQRVAVALSTVMLPVLGALAAYLESYDKKIDGHSSLLVVATKVRDVEVRT